MVNGILLNNAAITNGPAASARHLCRHHAQQCVVAIGLDFRRICRAAAVAGVFRRLECLQSCGCRYQCSRHNIDSWTYASARLARGQWQHQQLQFAMFVGFSRKTRSCSYQFGYCQSCSRHCGTIGVGIDATNALDRALRQRLPVAIHSVPYAGNYARHSGLRLSFCRRLSSRLSGAGCNCILGDAALADMQNGFVFTVDVCNGRGQHCTMPSPKSARSSV